MSANKYQYTHFVGILLVSTLAVILGLICRIRFRLKEQFEIMGSMLIHLLAPLVSVLQI